MISSPSIVSAAAILQSGGLVAFPTETVYGLGADASNEQAIRQIFQAKERPFDHPLIVHLADPDQLSDWAMDISSQAMKLALAFWPGPLTMILKKQPHVLDIVTGNQDTIGLRIPRHPVALALLKAFGRGVAAPSANKFTHISPTTASAVFEELGDKVSCILDGGACEVGLESTIIDMHGDQPVILRPGMISAEAIAEVLGEPVLSVRQDTPVVRAPGMHHLHYAPTTDTRLIASDQIADFLQQLSPADFPIALITQSNLSLPASEHIHHIKMSSQASVYAHDLYQTLRDLDHQQLKQIVIEAVSESSEWEAIRDRLNKASRIK